MSTISRAAVLVSLLAVATGSAYAQESTIKTHADVKAELTALERTGYYPNTDGVQYPDRLQAAQEHLANHQDPATGPVRSAGSDSNLLVGR